MKKKSRVKKNKTQRVKTFLGMPMNWDSRNMFKGLWDKNDPRLFPPKYFGIGWSLNFYTLFKKMGFIKKSKRK